MNLTEWKGNLRQSLAVNEIQANLDNLEKDLSRNLLPTLSQLQDFGDFKSKFWLDNDKEILDDLRRLKFRFKDGLPNTSIDVMFRVCSHLLVMIPWLRQQFKSRNINVEGMEMRQSNLLQMVELAEFAFDYMLNFTNILSHYEMAEDKVGNSSLTPTLEEKNDLNRWAFVLSVTILGRDLSDIKSAYGRVPALLADSEKFYDLMNSVGRSNADPLNLSAPPFPLSVVFYAQLAIADWQMSRLEKAEATAKAVSYRLALLRRSRAGEGVDAATEKQIEAYEARLTAVQRKISKWEQKYGLEGV